MNPKEERLDRGIERTIAPEQSPSAIAKAGLEALVVEHGDETFIPEGYAFGDDLVKAWAESIRTERAKVEELRAKISSLESDVSFGLTIASALRDESEGLKANLSTQRREVLEEAAKVLEQSPVYLLTNGNAKKMLAERAFEIRALGGKP